MKRILILGGTKFIGRNLVEKLQATNTYDLTLFNRQQSSSGLFPKLNKIKGDRETDDIKQIKKHNWDFVIDLSCYFPASMSSVLENLNQKPDKFIFVSTCSVYDNHKNSSELRNEDTPILDCTSEQGKEKTLKFYGNKKAECERILQRSGLNHAILRPALVYGAHDYTDRFYYWLYQVKKKSTLLLPDNGERKFSITYVNDLVETIIQLLTKDTPSNIHNLVTNPQLSIGKIVTTAMELLDSNPEIISAAPEFLKENNISQWTDMPLWIDGDYFTYSNQRLIDELNIEGTDFKKGTKETIAHYKPLGWYKPAYGMSEEKRLELIQQLKVL